MKINKIFAAILCLMTIVLGSCKEDTYSPAEMLQTAQVYFPSDGQSVYDLVMANDYVSVSVPLHRVKTDDKITVNVTATGADGDTIKVAKTVTFEEGSNAAMISIDVKTAELGYDNFKTINLSIADEDYKTPYGYSSKTIIVGVPAPWVSLGDATYIEQFVGVLFGVDNIKYPVEIQENNLIPGFYRLVFPYDGKYEYNGDGQWDDTQTYYLEIHAENPDKVYISTQAVGMDWGYGMFMVGTLAGYYHDKGDEAKAEPYYGTLVDGVLTFPANSLLLAMTDYNNGGLYSGGDGTPILVLPGYTLADFSVSATYQGIFITPSEQTFAVVGVTKGEDAKTVKAVVVEASVDPAAVADAIASGDIEATDVEDDIVYVPTDGLTGSLQIVTVSLDGDVVKEIDAVPFEYYGGGSNPWVSLGMGLYCDDFIAPLFTKEGEAITYEVEILESTEKPGLYRLVNPYGAAFPLNEPGDYDPNATTYVEIDATDPDGVFILPQSIGLDYGYGPMSICTEGGRYLSNYDFETLKEYGYFGKLQDGVISFPVFVTEDGSTEYQGITYMGSSGYYGGLNKSVSIALPEAVSASAKARANKAKAVKHADKAHGKVASKTMRLDKRLVKSAKKAI